MDDDSKVQTIHTGETDTIIACRTSQGYEIRATPLRITRHVVAFEVYNPYSIVQVSEVLSEFKMIMNDRLIYSGRAVVSNLVNTGIMLVCEATLDEAWLDVNLLDLVNQRPKLQADLAKFLKDWEKIYFIASDYKVVVADMQNFFVDLRRWLEQVELGVRSSPSGNRLKFEREIIEELAPPIVVSINTLFGRFEEVSTRVDSDRQPFHRTYAKRQLHPQLLCSPFAYRTYHKPLGYAGDYEMVNMILRDPLEGSSLFAKTVNLWFLRQAPAEAHRNRISYLTRLLAKEMRRVAQHGRCARIFNVGCGPAGEIQNLLAQDEISDQAAFTLLDFNDETLQYAGQTLENLKLQYGRKTKIDLIKKSVHQVLKEGTAHGQRGEEYDVVYCAGVFDYLSDRICKRLMSIFYDMLAPGGVMVVTNVDASNPSRQTMENMLEWHLVYRDRQLLEALAPDAESATSRSLQSDSTGCNIFLEIRKADRA